MTVFVTFGITQNRIFVNSILCSNARTKSALFIYSVKDVEKLLGRGLHVKTDF